MKEKRDKSIRTKAYEIKGKASAQVLENHKKKLLTSTTRLRGCMWRGRGPRGKRCFCCCNHFPSQLDWRPCKKVMRCPSKSDDAKTAQVNTPAHARKCLFVERGESQKAKKCEVRGRQLGILPACVAGWLWFCCEGRRADLDSGRVSGWWAIRLAGGVGVIR